VRYDVRFRCALSYDEMREILFEEGLFDMRVVPGMTVPDDLDAQFSMELMFALGASIEPFLYVLCLWALRNRPAGFGAMACFGILHREFTVFALPAFAIAGWREWRTWRPAGFAKAAGAFAGVWMVVAVLKRNVNIYGPGGGTYASGSLLLQVETILAYGLGGGLPVGAPVVLSYVLFVLLLPIAIFGWFFQRETARAWQVTVALLIVLWAESSAWDNLRLLREYVVSPPPSPHRVMADDLVSKGITHGRAIYRDAYRITFLARERVILTPDDVIRIPVYKTVVDAHAADAVTLQRQPQRSAAFG